jgi:hypothetical protein
MVVAGNTDLVSNTIFIRVKKSSHVLFNRGSSEVKSVESVLEAPFHTIATRIGTDGQQGTLVNVAHFGGLLFPLPRGVLIDAQPIDPNVFEA